MSKVDVFLDHTAEWLRGGDADSNIVVSSRIRLARNIEGYPFIQRLKDDDRKEIIRLVSEALQKISQQDIGGDKKYNSNDEQRH